MHKPLIVQILGSSRAGKDWTAEQLKLAFESQGKSVAIMSYAAPMKRITATLFGITLEELDLYKNNPRDYHIHVDNFADMLNINTTDFRVFLQRMGNEAMKSEFGSSVWADLMKTNISKSDVDVIIIPDCRFTIELETFPQAVTVRVINRDLPPPMNHASETELADFEPDFFLQNTAQSANKLNINSLVNSIVLKRPVFGRPKQSNV